MMYLWADVVTWLGFTKDDDNYYTSTNFKISRSIAITQHEINPVIPRQKIGSQLLDMQ